MSGSYRIVLLAGDGVGPEIVAATGVVMEAVAERFGVRFETDERLIGGCAIDAFETPLRGEDLDACRQADAVLLGAVGGPAWDNPDAKVRPEQGLLSLRRGMGLYANLRPVKVLPSLIDASPIKPERLAGVDFLFVRELTGGVYFGRPRRRWRERRGRAALDTMIYREHEVRRIVELAFDLAERRGGRVASVDKANVLDTSRLWRAVVSEIAADRPEVTVEHVLVDTMAMRLITGPASLDVVVTENMFGDILTDEASVLTGSIGLLPSASIGATREDGSGRRRGIFEPIHGSAPDIAGQGKANPIGTILSFALMLRLALGEERVAVAVEEAVEATLDAAVRTRDIAMGGDSVSTMEMAETIARRVAERVSHEHGRPRRSS